MKKVVCAFILLFMLTSTSLSAEKKVIRLGLLSKMNSTEEKFADAWKHTFAPRNETLEVITKFYDSLTAMQLALEAGDIMHMVLPRSSAEYVLNHSPNYESVLVLHASNMGLAFGFREDRKDLRDKFNEALEHMRSNWSLQTLEGIYTISVGNEEPDPVDFEKFEGAETIRVAVTGDLPPIDYIAADGTPAGYNTAVLAEIGAYLKKNIELIEVDAGARTAALASGRADVVFWYEVDLSSEVQNDVPDGVILSEPYHTWHNFIHIRKMPAGVKAKDWNIKRNILRTYGW